MLVDLTFTKHGVRKSIAKYWAYKGRCPTCRYDIVSHDFAMKGRPQFFGVGFRVWITYLRVALRLPYGNINMIIQDMSMKISLIRLLYNAYRKLLTTTLKLRKLYSTTF
jgi:hypothetical protein